MILYGNPATALLDYAPPSVGVVAPAYPPLFPFHPSTLFYYGNPAVTTFRFSAPSVGGAVPINPAVYRLIQPHILGTRGHYYEAGTVVTETSIVPSDIPVDWVPTLAVDPLNARAVAAFYAAGPRGIAYEDLNKWANSMFDNIIPSPIVVPVTYWVKRGNQYFLTGLGANLPPIAVPPFGG